MTLLKLVTEIHNLGGKCLLVGGAVIDSILGLEIKDWDIEIHGLSLEDIETFLWSHNIKCDLVGKAFGIIKCKLDDLEVDLSIPRKENKIGVGHKDFQVELDHTMTPKEAARRRDLTINSMYKDLYTEELVDPFGGYKDLMNGRIKATDPDTFIEDPLRVLRIMQLLPRKAKFVEESTLWLCRNMVHEFIHLPKERVFEEFNKLLLKASKPSVGLQFLRDSFWLVHFPELYTLIGCEQNPEWHPEGDVWNHTLMVVDNAAKIRDLIPEEDRLAFMYGALLHDVGKVVTTDVNLRSPGHANKGVFVARRFMERLTNNVDLIEKVCNLVEFHMHPGDLHRGNGKRSSWKRLHNNSNLNLLGWLSKCDSSGRTGRSLDDPHPPSELCWSFLEEFGEEPIPALVMGRDLIELGLKPGPEFGIILSKLYEFQLEDDTLTKKDLIKLI